MKLLCRTLQIAALAGTFLAPTLAGAASDLPPTVIKLIGPSLNSPPWEIVKSIWSKIPDETGGRVKIEVQSLTELGLQGPEVYRMAKLGVANIVIAALSFTSGDVPENDAMDFAGLALDIPTLRQAVDSYAPTLEKLYLERSGVRVTGTWPLAAQVFWCAAPVKRIGDLKGLKVRVAGASLAEFVSSVGAIPTTLPFAEMIPALQRKVIDCAITGTVAGNLIKLYEVTSDIYPLTVGWGLEGNIVNERWWKGLDPRIRDLLLAKFRATTEEGWQQARIGTEQGLWCSGGDPRCDVNATKPLRMTKANLAVATISDEDKAERLRVVKEVALSKFAKRCGAPCIANWNQTVGKVFGVTARAQ